MCTNKAPISVAWVSYLNVAILVGTLSLALFNASKDEVARNMAYAYAVISVGTLVSASCLYRFVGSSIQSCQYRFMATQSISVELL